MNCDGNDLQVLIEFMTFVCKPFIKHSNNLKMELEKEAEKEGGGNHEKFKEKTKPTIEAVQFSNHVKQKVKEPLEVGQIDLQNEENIRYVLADFNHILKTLIDMREKSVDEQEEQYFFQ